MKSFTAEGITYSHYSDRGKQRWYGLQLERLSSVRPWSAIRAIGIAALALSTQSFA